MRRWVWLLMSGVVLLSGCRQEAEEMLKPITGVKNISLGMSGTAEEADNSWAMFLVNEQNPLDREYSENIELSVVYESWRTYSMDSRTAGYIMQMIEDAREDGIELIVMSAYRSFDRQEEDVNNTIRENMVTLGMNRDEAEAAALKTAQRPGYSEHNAGIAVDILSDEYTYMDDDGFKNTKAYAWLQENAADYGFILRYPEDGFASTGMSFEPWHYRFVGQYYARIIIEKGVTLEEFFEEMNWVDEEGRMIGQ